MHLTFRWCRLLFSIPLLPAEEIRQMWNKTLRFRVIEFETNELTIKFNRLKNYYHRYWMTIIEPSEISVYDLAAATNNGSVSFTV